ncbi:hypothetical protein ACFL0S_04285 [Thermodesulfobacteriota bacterium]
MDPLTCPKCTGEMRIIIFIYQYQVSKEILEHLKIYEEKKQRTPPTKKTAIKEVEILSFDDGLAGV